MTAERLNERLTERIGSTQLLTLGDPATRHENGAQGLSPCFEKRPPAFR